MRLVVDGHDPRLHLAQRLRGLRTELEVTQPMLAQVLKVSVPLISSWESQTNPRIPPLPRLEAYAALFAAPRGFDLKPPQAVHAQDLSDEERQAMTELKRELMHLRSQAMGADPEPGSPGAVKQTGLIQLPGPWRFADEDAITIVCAQLPQEMLEQMPYTDKNDPDYIELLTYSELDSLFELYGHIRATNPVNQVNLRAANSLAPDDYTSHLASLGGVDWNTATSSMLDTLKLPVRQIADWDTQGGQYFEAVKDGETLRYHPILGESRNAPLLVEDVALFARAVSPFNQERTVTICNGMYGRGTYGAVRALTDARFRDRNAQYLRSRFGNSSSYCILTRVRIVNGVTLTPDWTIDDSRLFEWSM